MDLVQKSSLHGIPESHVKLFSDRSPASISCMKVKREVTNFMEEGNQLSSAQDPVKIK